MKEKVIWLRRRGKERIEGVAVLYVV